MCGGLLLANFVYILQSEATGRYYCGSTNNVGRRLRQHNDPQYLGTKTTKRFKGPWKLIFTSTYASRSEAMKHERQIKKRGIGRFLRENAQFVESRSEREEAVGCRQSVESIGGPLRSFHLCGEYPFWLRLHFVVTL